MAKKRPPGWQKRQELKQSSTPGVTLLHGQEAVDSFQALLDRMERHPERFMFLDDDDLDDYLDADE